MGTGKIKMLDDFKFIKKLKWYLLGKCVII